MLNQYPAITSRNFEKFSQKLFLFDIFQLEYETYINHLSEHEQLKIQSGSLENEVTGLLTGAGQGHLFGSMALGDEGAPGPFEADLVAEEEFRNLELEAEYQFLLENNQKLEDIFSSLFQFSIT